MDYNPDHILHNGKLHDGDPDNGIEASIDAAEHMNAITDEILAVIVAGGGEPDVETLDQLLTSLKNMFEIDVAFNVLTGSAILRFPGASKFVMQLGTGPGHHSGTYFTGRVTFEEAFDYILKVVPSLHTNGANDLPASLNYFDMGPGGFSYNLSKFQNSGAYTIMYLAFGIINE